MLFRSRQELSKRGPDAAKKLATKNIDEKLTQVDGGIKAAKDQLKTVQGKADNLDATINKMGEEDKSKPENKALIQQLDALKQQIKNIDQQLVKLEAQKNELKKQKAEAEKRVDKMASESKNNRIEGKNLQDPKVLEVETVKLLDDLKSESQEKETGRGIMYDLNHLFKFCSNVQKEDVVKKVLSMNTDWQKQGLEVRFDGTTFRFENVRTSGTDTGGKGPNSNPDPKDETSKEQDHSESLDEQIWKGSLADTREVIMNRLIQVNKEIPNLKKQVQKNVILSGVTAGLYHVMNLQSNTETSRSLTMLQSQKQALESLLAQCKTIENQGVNAAQQGNKGLATIREQLGLPDVPIQVIDVIQDPIEKEVQRRLHARQAIERASRNELRMK